MKNPTPPEVSDVLRTQRVEIVGADGTVRIVLGELPDPTVDAPPVFGLAVQDRSGNPRAWLAILPTGPTLTFDRHGNVGMELGVDDGVGEGETARAYLVMADGDGAPGMAWRVSDDGAVAMSVMGVTQ